MEADFIKADCPRCKYIRADKSTAKDGSQEHFICYRCGYHYLIVDGKKEKEYFGIGAWCIVGEKGIFSGAIYMDEKFYGKISELRKAIQGGKLFYTRVDSIGKYLLVDHETGIKHEFGNDMEICLEGLKKISQ